MSKTEFLSIPSLVVGALLASGVWLTQARPFATVETARSPMTTDAVATVARNRQASVVLLHSLTSDSAGGLERDSRGLFTAPVREGIGSGIVIDTTR